MYYGGLGRGRGSKEGFSEVSGRGDNSAEPAGQDPQVRSEIVERLVKELGMSLAEAVRLLGISTSAISKILHRIAQKSSEEFKSINDVPPPLRACQVNFTRSPL